MCVQIILAFGNYMNSSKRGGVYGFKLQSLDIVSYGRVLSKLPPCTFMHFELTKTTLMQVLL